METGGASLTGGLIRGGADVERPGFAADLMLANMRSPVVDAVCATVCRNWSEATDLWLDVHGELHYKELAAQCGLEASIQAGQFDLSEYFYIRCREFEIMPNFISDLWTEYKILKRERTRFYSMRITDGLRPVTSATVKRQVHLRLYDWAVRDIFSRPDFHYNRGLWLPLLAECYYRSGYHAALVALHARWPGPCNTPIVKAKVERAERLLTRRDGPVMENIIRFQERHPAGSILMPLLEACRTPADG